MPTYGYECLSCHNAFEVFQSIKENALTICESCGGSLRKRIYPVGIAFKGSGFYVNDYAAKSDLKAVPSETKSEATKPSAEGEVKTEAKPEAAKAEIKTESKSEAKPATTAA